MNISENIYILDPWNIKPFVLNYGRIIIKGPSNKGNRVNLYFSYRHDENKSCDILQTINRTNNYNNIELKLYKDKAIIENISRSSIYRGSEYMLLALQIIYRLGYKTSILKDVAYFTCDRKMNYFTNKYKKNINKDLNYLNSEYKMEIQNKLIYLLRFGTTFYMPFGFKPIMKIDKLLEIDLSNIKDYDIKIEKNNKNLNNYKNISEIINKLLEKLYIISWDDINNYINSIEKLLNNNTYKNSNRLSFNYRVMNYTKWKNYWKNICYSWNKFYQKFSNKVDSPFLAFYIYDKNECDLFINWLELYSFSINQSFMYSSNIFNNKLIEEKILTGIDSFKKLKLLLEKCEWINDDIKRQPLVSIYMESI